MLQRVVTMKCLVETSTILRTTSNQTAHCVRRGDDRGDGDRWADGAVVGGDDGDSAADHCRLPRGDVGGVHGDNPANTVGSPVHPRGFLRDASGDFRDLAAQNATVTQVFGVNDARDVVGAYTDTASKTHGFVARLGNQGNR